MSLGAYQDITVDQLDKLHVDKPFVLFIQASWCPFSKKGKPSFKAVAQTLSSHAHFFVLELKEFHENDPVYAYVHSVYNTTIKVVPTTLVVSLDRKVTHCIEEQLETADFLNSLAFLVPVLQKKNMHTGAKMQNKSKKKIN